MGSYGEVYRGDYNGTDVAVKNFFDDVMLQEGFVEVGGGGGCTSNSCLKNALWRSSVRSLIVH